MMENKPLLHWQYTPEDWNDFVDIEKANKKEDNIYMAIGILILAPPTLMFFRGTTFWTGLLFALPLAFLIPFLRFKFSYSHLKKNAVNPELKVYDSFLQINHRRVELFNDKRSVKSLKIIDTKNQRKLLEFDVEWTTRKGNTNDEFRFLIPTEKLEEATKFTENYKS